MASSSDGTFRRGLASSFVGLGMILLGGVLALTGLTFSGSGLAGLAFLGLLVAFPGAAVVVLGARDLERSGRTGPG